MFGSPAVAVDSALPADLTRDINVGLYYMYTYILSLYYQQGFPQHVFFSRVFCLFLGPTWCEKLHAQVNYVGHPFNTSLAENVHLALALRWGGVFFVVATLNFIPGTAWALSLVSPSSSAISVRVSSSLPNPAFCRIGLPFISSLIKAKL